jgi:hypothetical protein
VNDEQGGNSGFGILGFFGIFFGILKIQKTVNDGISA